MQCRSRLKALLNTLLLKGPVAFLRVRHKYCLRRVEFSGASTALPHPLAVWKCELALLSHFRSIVHSYAAFRPFTCKAMEGNGRWGANYPLWCTDEAIAQHALAPHTLGDGLQLRHLSIDAYIYYGRE
jgi:hypothetical protein